MGEAVPFLSQGGQRHPDAGDEKGEQQPQQPLEKLYIHVRNLSRSTVSGGRNNRVRRERRSPA